MHRRTHIDVELLVHVSASSKAEDDARYRAQAQGYLDFDDESLHSQSVRGRVANERISSQPYQSSVAAQPRPLGTGSRLVEDSSAQPIQSSLLGPAPESQVSSGIFESSGVATVPISSPLLGENEGEGKAHEGGGHDASPQSFDVNDNAVTESENEVLRYEEKNRIKKERPLAPTSSSSLPISIKATPPQTRSWNPSFTSQDARDLLSFAEREMPATVMASAKDTVTAPERAEAEASSSSSEKDIYPFEQQQLNRKTSTKDAIHNKQLEPGVVKVEQDNIKLLQEDPPSTIGEARKRPYRASAEGTRARKRARHDPRTNELEGNPRKHLM